MAAALPPPRKQAPPPEVKDRLAVVETVYHQSHGEQPTSAETKFSRTLQTREQPFVRKALASEEWKPLETGWLSEASMLVIENNEGRFTQTQPTPEERADAARRVMEWGVAVAGGVVVPVGPIPPGESARFQPGDLKALRVRSQHRSAKYTASVFPK